MSTNPFKPGFRDTLVKVLSRNPREQAGTSSGSSHPPTLIELIPPEQMRAELAAKEHEMEGRKQHLDLEFKIRANFGYKPKLVTDWEQELYAALEEARNKQLAKSPQALNEAQANGDVPFENWNFYCSLNFTVVCSSLDDVWSEDRIRVYHVNNISPTSAAKIVAGLPLLNPKRALEEDLERFIAKAKDYKQGTRVTKRWTKELRNALEEKIGKRGLYTDKGTWLKVQVVLDRILAADSLVGPDGQILAKFSVENVVNTLLDFLQATRGRH